MSRRELGKLFLVIGIFSCSLYPRPANKPLRRREENT